MLTKAFKQTVRFSYKVSFLSRIDYLNIRAYGLVFKRMRPVKIPNQIIFIFTNMCLKRFCLIRVKNRFHGF